MGDLKNKAEKAMNEASEAYESTRRKEQKLRREMEDAREAYFIADAIEECKALEGEPYADRVQQLHERAEKLLSDATATSYAHNVKVALWFINELAKVATLPLAALPRRMQTIIVRKRAEDFHASFENDVASWGCSESRDGAIGDLVRSHPERFGVRVDDRAGGQR